MKKHRIIYYLLMAASLFWGLASGVQIMYVIFFTMVLVALAGLGLNLWTVFSFAFVQEMPTREATKGDRPVLHLRITNDKPFPFTMMRIRVAVPDLSDRQELVINLAPHHSASYDIPLTLPYRGSFELGMTTLEIQDIFGLAPLRMDLRRLPYYRMRSFLVYPRLLGLPGIQPPPQDYKEFKAASRTTNDGDSFSHLRDYIPGDSAKRIHWKASAKTRTLLTRLYELPGEDRALLFIDSSAGEAAGEEALICADKICESAVAILHYQLENRHMVRLAGADPAREGLDCAGLGDFEPAYRWIALLPFAGSAATAGAVLRAELTYAQAVGTVYIVGEQPRAEVLAGLMAAASDLGGITYLVTRKNELDIPPRIRVEVLPGGDDIAGALAAILEGGGSYGR